MPDICALVVDGESPFAMAVVSCLAAANVRVHVLSRAPKAPIRLSRFVASFQVLEGSTAEAERISQRAREVGADVCLAVDEDGISRIAGEWRSIEGVAAVGPVPSP